MKQLRFLLATLMAVAFMPGAWAEVTWTNTHVETKDVTVNGVSYQICHVYTQQARIVEQASYWGGGYQESPAILTEQYYASVTEISASGEVQIPEAIYDGGKKYDVRYIGLLTEQTYRTENKQYTYEFLGTTTTGYTTCEYYNINESTCSVNAANVTKLTFLCDATFKGSFTAPSCTSIEFKKYATIESKAVLTCNQLTKFVFATVFVYTKSNSPRLLCPNLKGIYFNSLTPTLSGSWSDYSTASASGITVYLNESQDVCDHLHTYSTVWNEFKTVSPLPEQTNPTRNISFTIKGGRVKVGNSSTYILSDANYQVEQFSDFTFQVTKLYGSDYLVKSVKINGDEMLDAMTLTQGATDAWSYYSYTISPVINDVHIAVEGESIYDNAYAICSAGGICKWSNQSLSTITPNQNAQVRWLKSSENPPSLIIMPNEGYTLDRLYHNSYDNTYRVTDKGDGTFEYPLTADVKVSVVFKEIPPMTTWNVSLPNNEIAVSATMTDKRNDEYRYTLTDGENTVLAKPESITMRIDGAGTPLVQADGADLSSCFTLTSEWYGEYDEYGNMITEDYYSGTIPAESLEATNWFIGIRNESQHLWTSILNGDAEGGSFTLSGGSLADELNLSADHRNGFFADNASDPTIAAGFSLTSTLAVPKGYAFTVKFNDTDLTGYYAYDGATESAANYQAVFDGSQSALAALVSDGAWVVEFTKSTADIIEFADANVKAICVQNWDTDHDGELSKAEAAAVTTLIVNGTPAFKGNINITSFDELQHFTGLEALPDSAFWGCSKLKSIHVPDNVNTWGLGAFYGGGLEQIVFPKGLKTIPRQCFMFCKFVSLVIPEGVESIEAFALRYCSSLKSVHLPQSLKNIGPYQFDSGNQPIKTLVIPAGVTSISGNVVQNFDDLVVEVGNTTYDSREGCGCIIRTRDNTILYASNHAWIPESVTAIGSSAFYKLKTLTAIEIPAGITSIASFAFYGCEQLKTIVSKIQTPFAFGKQAFDLLPSDCVLTVPKGTRDAYIAAGWTTKETDPSGIFLRIEEAKPTASGTLGDIDGDEKVDITDVTKLVDIILGKD